ncbi:MAG: acyltransferase family protein, partial [Pseudomonadales bacterium]
MKSGRLPDPREAFSPGEPNFPILLGSAPLVGIGLISYSAYLWHQPLLAFARQMSPGEFGGVGIAALFLLILVLAYLTWRYVENPFRDPRRIQTNTALATMLMVSMIIVSVGVGGYLSSGYA